MIPETGGFQCFTWNVLALFHVKHSSLQRFQQIEDDLGDQCHDDDKEHGSDKAAAATNGKMRPKETAGDIECRHGQSNGVEHVPGHHEKDEGAKIRGEIQNFGRGGGAQEVVAKQAYE